jgi:hypothetical protein
MDFEQKASVKKAREVGENMTAEVIPDAHKPAGKLDPVIEKLKDVMGLLELGLRNLRSMSRQLGF